MKISLYLPNKIVDFYLPNEISGSFSFDADEVESKLINVEARNGAWVLYQTSDVAVGINNTFVNNIQLTPNNFYILNRDGKNYLIYVSKSQPNSIITYKYNSNIQLLIGSTDDCNIRYNCPYINESKVMISLGLMSID